MNPLRRTRTLLLCVLIGLFPLGARGQQLKGHLAPSFTQATMDGKVVRFPDDYKGKIVILNFWATWCRFCLAEQPAIAQAYKRFWGRHFDVLALTMDNPKEEKKIAAVTQARGMVWPQIYHNVTSFAGNVYPSGAGKLYFPGGIIAIPQTYLVDGDTGKVLAVLNSENILSETEKALKEKFGEGAVSAGSTGVLASFDSASSVPDSKTKFYLPERLFDESSVVIDGKSEKVTSVLVNTHAYESAEITIYLASGETLNFEIPVVNAKSILAGLVSAPGNSPSMGYLEYDASGDVVSKSWDTEQAQYLLNKKATQTGTGATAVTISVAGVKDGSVYTLISATFDGVLRRAEPGGTIKTVKVSGSFKNAVFAIPTRLWKSLPISKEIEIK